MNSNFSLEKFNKSLVEGWMIVTERMVQRDKCLKLHGAFSKTKTMDQEIKEFLFGYMDRIV